MGENSRYRAILNGAALWGSFYRANPDKFVEQYLHVRLKWFQKMLSVMMFWSTVFTCIAARGLGKTFISAIYCVARCILYPGSKVCIASGTRGQAINVLEKILYELKPGSPELAAEINDKETKINGTNAQLMFYNTSVIKVVTASDSARGNRCHVLLLDEFRLMDKDIVDTVLRKFLTLRRMPRYKALTEDERQAEYAKEKNLTLYLSSAYFKDSWAYQKCVDTFKAMIDPNRRQFVCGFPYQLSIAEGLLDPELVEDDLGDTDFSSIRFSMEMEALFYGSAEDAFFDFDSISKMRKIRYPMLPDKISAKINAPYVRIQPKQNGERRIMSADIALMSSRKHNNDATAIFINQMLPTKVGRYASNIVYADAYEGLRTDDQALIIRKMFDEYMCDYLVLDTNGIGLGVYDALAREITDPETGEVYPALSCMNDKAMADRCTVPGAQKVIWSVKASQTFNSDCAIGLREGFRSGRIRLLANEYDAEEILGELKGYNGLNPPERMQFQLPYIHTTLLIDEIIKLDYEETGGKIRISEQAGMRKDRYSSLSYNYYVATQIEQKLNRRQNTDLTDKDLFIIRPPSYTGKAVSRYGKENRSSWGRGI